MPIKRWMNKQNVVYPYNRIFSSHKKGWSTDICYIMNEPLKLYAKWKKPDTEDHVLYDSIYMN